MSTKVPVYFIGKHFENVSRRPIFNVRGRTYQCPKNLGDSVQVDPADVAELIEKSKVYIRNKGFQHTFTTDLTVAKAMAKAGSVADTADRFSLQDALGLLNTPDVLKSVLNTLSDEERLQLLSSIETPTQEEEKPKPAPKAATKKEAE